MRATRSQAVLVLLGLVLVVVWFITRQNRPEDPAPAPSPTPSVTVTALPKATPTPTGAPTATPADILDIDDPEPDGEIIDPRAPAVPRNEVEAGEFRALEQVATGFMTAFARPGPEVSAEQWWAGVEPLLDDAVTGDYAGVDPRNVAFTTVGAAAVIPAQSPSLHLLAVVRVSTDAGDYLVELRTDAAGTRVTYVGVEVGS